MKKLLLMPLLLLFVTGCEPGAMMAIPDHPPLQKIDLAGKKTATIAFERAAMSIDQGTTIAWMPFNMKMPMDDADYACNIGKEINRTLQWDGGLGELRGWDSDLGRLFYETMKGEGIAVAGNPVEAFKETDKKSSADFLVAAEIKAIRGNICELFLDKTLISKSDSIKLDKEAGEMYAEVKWTVYSPASQKKVGTYNTYGYGRFDSPVTRGVMATFNRAFANSVANLAATKDFVALLTSSDSEKVRQEELAKYDRLTIKGVPKSSRSASEVTTVLTRSNVILRLATGHGSGFVISPDGYILTAEHVVGNMKKITAKFDNGLELPADVVRSNAYRDVALLKVDVRGLTPLPIETEGVPKVMDEVFAVGSPIKEELGVTVTRGVVSALREKDEAKDLVLIQSDVGISGGNSGGPLVDKNGNAVGIAVSGIGVYQLNTGLNFFVPISDALKYLNLTVAQEKDNK